MHNVFHKVHHFSEAENTALYTENRNTRRYCVSSHWFFWNPVMVFFVCVCGDGAWLQAERGWEQLMCMVYKFWDFSHVPERSPSLVKEHGGNQASGSSLKFSEVSTISGEFIIIHFLLASILNTTIIYLEDVRYIYFFDLDECELQIIFWNETVV